LDVATIIQALEGLFPLRPEDRNLATSSRWQQVVTDSKKKARILTSDMDQSRRDTFNEWSSAEDRIGPIPYLSNYEILKDLSRCFTSKDNQAGTSRSNVQFQRDLNAMIQGDQDYHTSPTLARLCEMVAHIMHQWEALTAENDRMGGNSGTSSTTSKAKASKSRDDAPASAGTSSTTAGRTYQGCNRANHTREFYRLRFHPDFNREGPWAGSSAERTVRVWDPATEVQLPWKTRADGSVWTGTAEPRNSTGPSE